VKTEHWAYLKRSGVPTGEDLVMINQLRLLTCQSYSALLCPGSQKSLLQWWLLRAGKSQFEPGPTGQWLNVPSEGHEGNPFVNFWVGLLKHILKGKKYLCCLESGTSMPTVPCFSHLATTSVSVSSVNI